MVRRHLKVAITRTGYYRALRRAAAWRHPGSRLLVLTYHNLSDGSEYSRPGGHPRQLRPELTTEILDVHLRTLKRLYEVVSLDEGVRRLLSNRRTDFMATVTFDDGYRSFARLAFPLLQRHGVPATVFLPTRFIGRTDWFWWDRLHRLVYELWTAPPPLAVLAPILGPEAARELHASSRNVERGRVALRRLERDWLRLPASERTEALDRLASCLSAQTLEGLQPDEVLTWDEVRALKARGVSFGSHTASHLNLRYASSAEADLEIAESVDRLAAETGDRPETLAYPYGGDAEHYRPLRPLLQKHGIAIARTMHAGSNRPSADPLLLQATHMILESSPPLVERHLLQSHFENELSQPDPPSASPTG